MVDFLNGVPSASEEKIHRIFVTDKDRSNPTQMYFIQEILSTLAKFDNDKKEWVLRSKYKNVKFAESKKRTSNEYQIPKKKSDTAPGSSSATDKKQSESSSSRKRSKTSPDTATSTSPKDSRKSEEFVIPKKMARDSSGSARSTPSPAARIMRTSPEPSGPITSLDDIIFVGWPEDKEKAAESVGPSTSTNWLFNYFPYLIFLLFPSPGL